jgi:hypothetical protein
MHQARNLVAVVLGGIETNNLEMAKLAAQRLEAHIALWEVVQRVESAAS